MGLFERKPIWMKSDYNSCEKAKELIYRTNNQQKLVKIAKESTNWDVRIKAIAKITDKTELAYIAEHDVEELVSKEAVKYLHDQSILANIAKQHNNSNVRRAAVEKLTDQVLLIDIAQHDDDRFVRKAAVEILFDQTARERTKTQEIGWKGFYTINEPKALAEYVRIAAEHIYYKHFQLYDYKQLLDLAVKAIDRIDDTWVLTELVIATVSYYEDTHRYGKIVDFLFTVVDRISDENLLLKIAKEAHEYFGVQAVKKMTDKDKLHELTEHVRTHSFSYESESYSNVTSESGSFTYREVANAATKRLKTM